MVISMSSSAILKCYPFKLKQLFKLEYKNFIFYEPDTSLICQIIPPGQCPILLTYLLIRNKGFKQLQTLISLISVLRKMTLNRHLPL